MSELVQDIKIANENLLPDIGEAGLVGADASGLDPEFSDYAYLKEELLGEAINQYHDDVKLFNQARAMAATVFDVLWKDNVLERKPFASEQSSEYLIDVLNRSREVVSSADPQYAHVVGLSAIRVFVVAQRLHQLAREEQ
jgi:hypothetical protein